MASPFDNTRMHTLDDILFRENIRGTFMSNRSQAPGRGNPFRIHRDASMAIMYYPCLNHLVKLYSNGRCRMHGTVGPEAKEWLDYLDTLLNNYIRETSHHIAKLKLMADHPSDVRDYISSLERLMTPDSGPGMPKDDWSKVFSKLYLEEPNGDGSEQIREVQGDEIIPSEAKGKGSASNNPDYGSDYDHIEFVNVNKDGLSQHRQNMNAETAKKKEEARASVKSFGKRLSQGIWTIFRSPTGTGPE
ncbi:hypothetical protein QBC43DRAFT_355261 [Cladorrhinum sp. PSN259]|nr:hypothetical protein QBC43DRAFT_355261 [Cladorrhinum sp. PSN259]